MLEQYKLSMPKAVFSGSNAIEQIETIVNGYYRKVAVFTDKGIRHSGVIDEPLAILNRCNTEIVILDDLPAEPTYLEAQSVVDDFKKSGADFIIAIGGGSVMDMAKLASIACTGSYTIKDLLADPLLGKKLVKTLMIPTTAGTGSEATPNSIVTVPEQNLKVGIVNAELIADYVILDGRMIRKLPKKIAAATGIDALAHAIECYTSNKANPFSNMFAMEALKLIFANIIPACVDAGAEQEKNNMLLAAFYAGVAITASGTTGVHALSYPLGGRYHIPHGVSNAIMLLPVLKYNKEVCLEEFSSVYDMVAGPDQHSREEKADWILGQIHSMIDRLEIPVSLKTFGIGEADLNDLVHDAMEVKRLLANNKREITPEDARKLYLEIM
ncbi:MAG TPA: iron-containing alcohol dehydrogenase [Mobilitalea sp.]|nr:iron-containing alcohol dehydrogenase [Mobilitalea sp.]